MSQPMKSSSRVNRYVMVATVLTALAGLFVMGAASPSRAAASLPVLVQNTVPVSQSGSWTVGVAGTPSVTLSGTPSVNIANSPTVTLAADASVQDADNPARQPIQFYTTVTFSENSGDAFLSIDLSTLPAGKRVVIEHVSAFGLLAADQELTLASVYTWLGSGPFVRPHFFKPEVTGNYATNSGPAKSWVVSAETRLYADTRPPQGVGTSLLAVKMNRNSGVGTPSFDFSLSGYLVDVE
jgi:hypothetical protein